MKKFVILFLCMLSMTSYAQELPPNFSALLNNIEPKLIGWRQHFHEFPELSNREFNTGKYIADYLKSIGLEVQYPIAKTGVVAILKGGKPGPAVGLRADIDALPIVERVNIPFASKVKGEYNGQPVGVMHACGHDAHTAILMATATALQKMQKEVPGTVVFLFQPAEEGAPNNEEGGAPLMIKEGAMDHPKLESVYGLHMAASMPVGMIAYKAGADHVIESNWTTAAEDFSFYGEKAPTFFFSLGGMQKGKKANEVGGHHTPDFYLDESGFILGVKAFCNLVFDNAIK